jgi:GNAT superfamily N-acetyltransferase
VSVSVRPLEPGDREAWSALWAGYLRFYRARVAPEVTDGTFDRLCERADGLAGLVAIGDGGELVGLAHLVFHPSTWSAGAYAYLEDLFVAPAARGSGAGRALFEAVYAQADARGADRVYWHTQEYNAAARSLYDQVGHRTSFIVYER